MRISRVAFGCEALGGWDCGRVDNSKLAGAIERALERGINAFDTADVYGLGRSEERLSELLGARRHEAIIITKFGVNWRSNPAAGRAATFRDCRPERVGEAIENSLRRLRIDCIPLYLVHWPDPKIPIEHTVEALSRYRDLGKIREIGLSNSSVELIERAIKIVPLAAVEFQYSLIDRSPEGDIFDCCRRLELHTLAYGALGQGLLSGKYDMATGFEQDDRRSRLRHFRAEEIRSRRGLLTALSGIAAQEGATSAQIAIRWVLANEFVGSVIIGAKSPEQVDECFNGLAAPLGQLALSVLNAASER
jgi:aryl-alcohol dehydrogenase-like predicted oxidoreductase